jgi:hypothetical protein
MQSRSALIKSASRQRTILLIAILGLSLTLACSAPAWAASSENERPSALAADSSPNVPAMSETGLSLGFTMADFTGDTHPDLAIVELNSFDSVSALYVIDVQFSEGGRQLLRMKAPLGGLFITAKDVTGDGNLDLVIRAATSGSPLTIFLNDGRGHFTATSPSAFTNIHQETRPGREFAVEHFYFSATLISSRSSTINSQHESARNPGEKSRAHAFATCRVYFCRSVPFSLDRAPPTTT